MRVSFSWDFVVTFLVLCLSVCLSVAIICITWLILSTFPNHDHQLYMPSGRSVSLLFIYSLFNYPPHFPLSTPLKDSSSPMAKLISKYKFQTLPITRHPPTYSVVTLEWIYFSVIHNTRVSGDKNRVVVSDSEPLENFHGNNSNKNSQSVYMMID